MKLIRSAILPLAAAACLLVAAVYGSRLSRARAAHGLGPAAAMDNAPPLVNLATLVLGGFRGMIADVLWLRVSYLQEQGQYVEIVQLADWITRLEPQFPEVWSFHAANMAYNISAMMNDPQDRWRWVRNGIELLRDEGLLHNARTADLYCEIGWLYQHKIGGRTDGAHMFYKQRLAEQMESLFEGPRPDYAALAERPGNADRMREEYKLLPGIMQELENRYGRLDWRLPETHAAYWAYRGLKVADENRSLRCRRMLYQSLGTAFFAGALAYDPHEGVYTVSSRPQILDGALAAFDETLAHHDNPDVRAAHSNFLSHAVFSLHALGEDDRAAALYETLAGTYPSSRTTKGLAGYLDAYREQEQRR